MVSTRRQHLLKALIRAEKTWYLLFKCRAFSLQMTNHGISNLSKIEFKIHCLQYYSQRTVAVFFYQAVFCLLVYRLLK